ncbi:MAG: aldehyde dehydrogenase family protein, partial [Anaerovoracaceae bacterium]
MKLCKLYIDGEWKESSSGAKVETLNPATGEVLAEVTQATEEDVNAAVAAAKKSFYETREWRDMDSQTRSD